MSREISMLEKESEKLLEEISLDQVVGADGKIDNALLRRFITQETSLTEDSQFLTDYASAIDFEFQCVEGEVTSEKLTTAIRNLLLQKASIENFRHFQFKKNPDPKDPFQLPTSEFQAFFSCIEASTGLCLHGTCLAILGSAGSGVGMPIAILGSILLFILSPFFALANRAGHLAGITNRETPAIALSTWLITLAPTSIETYLMYHNSFKVINDRMSGDIEHSKLALFVSHVLCVYIMAIVFAINVAVAGKVSEQYQIAERFPSEKFKKLLEHMKSIGEKAQLDEPKNRDDKTLTEVLSETNFPTFLMKGKEMGAQHEKAIQLIMQTHLLSIEKQSAAAAAAEYSVQMPRN